MQVEINGSTFRIRLGYNAQSVLKVFNVLAFRELNAYKPPFWREDG